ncbi:MAG TPA: hypothetical protein ENN30_01780 [Candidatus Woesearchaeota archaeon]|nr:hypothetical protein [Candidatus Woesearchaeota archaeon]
MKKISKKSQVDVSLAIGAVIVPVAALIGALLFTFATVADLANYQQLAAVIAYDVVTLQDVAYSVPDSVRIFYTPPIQCKFADTMIEGYCAGEEECWDAEDETACNALSASNGCVWELNWGCYGLAGRKICMDVLEGNCGEYNCVLSRSGDFCIAPECDVSVSECSGVGHGCYVSSGECIGGVGYEHDCFDITQNFIDGVAAGGDEQELEQDLETTCKSTLGCSWKSRRQNIITCMDGNLKIIGASYESLLGELDSVGRTEVYGANAVLRTVMGRGDTMSDKFYPGHGDSNDYYMRGSRINLMYGGKIEVSKDKSGLFDTVSRDDYKTEGDFLFLILKTGLSACASEKSQSISGFIPVNYGIKLNEDTEEYSMVHVSDGLVGHAHGSPTMVREYYSFKISDFNNEKCTFVFDDDFVDAILSYEGNMLIANYSTPDGLRFVSNSELECTLVNAAEECGHYKVTIKWARS